MGSPYVIDYQEVFALPLPPDQVWAELQRMDRFESWWSWLRQFHVDSGGLVAGAVLEGDVVPPLPFRMHLQVVLRDCVPAERIEATVRGDLEGRAELLLTPDGDGSHAQVSWSIEMMQRPMRLAALVAYPMLRWGHDRLVELTVSGFRRQLLDRDLG